MRLVGWAGKNEGANDSDLRQPADTAAQLCCSEVHCTLLRGHASGALFLQRTRPLRGAVRPPGKTESPTRASLAEELEPSEALISTTEGSRPELRGYVEFLELPRRSDESEYLARYGQCIRFVSLPKEIILPVRFSRPAMRRGGPEGIRATCARSAARPQGNQPA